MRTRTKIALTFIGGVSAWGYLEWRHFKQQRSTDLGFDQVKNDLQHAAFAWEQISGKTNRLLATVVTAQTDLLPLRDKVAAYTVALEKWNAALETKLH